MSKPELVPTDKPTTEATDSIAKPEGFDLDRFKSKRAAAMANVETLLDALPVHTSRRRRTSSGCTRRKISIGRRRSVS
jgi:hypothetical protein